MNKSSSIVIKSSSILQIPNGSNPQSAPTHSKSSSSFSSNTCVSLVSRRYLFLYIRRWLVINCWGLEQLVRFPCYRSSIWLGRSISRRCRILSSSRRGTQEGPCLVISMEGRKSRRSLRRLLISCIILRNIRRWGQGLGGESCFMDRRGRGRRYLRGPWLIRRDAAS